MQQWWMRWSPAADGGGGVSAREKVLAPVALSSLKRKV